MAGLQCLKRLYLACYFPEFADPINAKRQALFDTGNAIGELARKMYPGGVLVSEAVYIHGTAVEKTKALISDGATPAIYEAAFTFDGIRIRIDVLERLKSGLRPRRGPG